MIAGFFKITRYAAPSGGTPDDSQVNLKFLFTLLSRENLQQRCSYAHVFKGFIKIKSILSHNDFLDKNGIYGQF